jgi:hypothetical protein
VQRFNPGSKRLQILNSAKGAGATRGVKLSAEAVERRRRTALKLGLRPKNGYGGSKPWTAKELNTLGSIPDKVLAKKLGRSEKAVRLKRTRSGIVKLPKRRWTANEDALLRLPAIEVAQRTGRTIRAVRGRLTLRIDVSSPP